MSQDPEFHWTEASPPLLLGERAARRQLGGIGHTLYWKLIRNKELEPVRIGRRSFVTARSVEMLIARGRG